MVCKHKSTNLSSSTFANYSIKHQTLVYKQLNDEKVLFQTNQFSISQS